MRKNISKVMAAFVEGKACSGGTCHTDGTTVYSYDMAIAQRGPADYTEVLAQDAGPTNTTRAHIKAALVYLERTGYFMPRIVATLTGHAPHVFRDRAGRDGYRDRCDGNRSGLRLVK